MHDVSSADVGISNVRGNAPVTVSHVLGEVVWLLSQSPALGGVTAADLTWRVMPPILKGQFHFFREGSKPVAVALWAMLDERSEQQLTSTSKVNTWRLDQDSWSTGDRLWLMDVVAPFATPANKQAELVFADLITGIFKGKAFKMIDKAATEDARRVISIDETAGADLIKTVIGQFGGAGEC